MKPRKTASGAKSLRNCPRHQHLSELSLTYEGSNKILRIHPPNISTRGMFINTSVPFPEGSVLKLDFRLARTGARITVRSEVRYCLPGAGLGVEFLDLPPESARVIQAEIQAGGVRPRKSRRTRGSRKAPR